MIWELIDEYKNEYQASGGSFHTDIAGPVILGLTMLAVNVVVLSIARSIFGFEYPALFLIILINCVIVPIVAWYPLRKAGL